MANIRLGEDLENRLNELAEATARSKTFYIKEAIQNYLDEYEETLLVLSVKERLKRGTEKTYTWDEVKEMFDLNDDE